MIILAIVLIFIAGLSDGICDSIQFHESYAKYGHLWSLDSWKDKKFLGAFVINFWHIFKFVMVLSFIGSAICCLHSTSNFNQWWEIAIEYFTFTIVFIIGFKITFK